MLIPISEKKGVVAVAWADTPDLTSYPDRESLKAMLAKVYPTELKSVPGIAGQLFRFAWGMRKGDTVVSYDQGQREYLVGTITSDYFFDTRLVGDGYSHVRRVKWEGRVARDLLSIDARNSLGSTLTVFELGDHLYEIRSLLSGPPTKAAAAIPQKEDLIPYHREVEGKARGLIADKLNALDGREFERLVAAVLRSMGYSTKVSEKGPDGGLDIRASPDALLLSDPRIKVQVKHRNGAASVGEIQQLVGAVGGHGRGLFVSTGGFTKDARREADRSQVPITLIDEDDFVTLLTTNYAKLEPEFRRFVPLKQAWIPIEE